MQLETPGGRGYSTQFVDHEGLLHKFARSGFARLQKAKVTWVDYDEVFGKMSMSFVEAEQKFDPQRGWTFAAYLGRVCMNNFNKWAADLIAEQTTCGYIRVSELSTEGDEGGETDFYEVMGGEDESPEDIIERLDYIHKARRSLSADAKLVVRELAAPCAALEQAVSESRRESASVAFICRFLGFSATRIKRVKQELTEKFGVEL